MTLANILNEITMSLTTRMPNGFDFRNFARYLGHCYFINKHLYWPFAARMPYGFDFRAFDHLAAKVI